ncbi:aspartate aminotransferase family protein [Streptomyces sp. NPDC059477]|uniref:aspartate aminotransferase family protein n=1 Tax=Streptomyces sp. NPDC059477 TaxID=3346847 RepID=UPI0036B449B3
MRFDVSRQRIRDGSRYVAGGVNSAFRAGIRPTPLVFESAHGARLVDADGNHLLDYVLGMGPMLLGHSPAPVLAAARAQLGRSVLVAGQTSLEYEAARLVTELVPAAGRVRFSSTGSEAVQSALRLARAATGRRVVVKFEGHYHGWFDNVLWSVAPDPAAAGPANAPVPVPGSAGQLPAQDIAVLPWNDTDAVRARLAPGDVAAVIMEPVMFNNGGVPPRAGYLAAVRDLCAASGTLLIFDEVITGFRVSPGGAQARLGVLPDLTVLGKALGNGFPVAALAGPADLMELIGDRRVLHGGTYNTQSVAMAATTAVLREIATGEPHTRIARTGARLISGLEKAFGDAGVSAQVAGYPAVFHVRFTDGPPPQDYRSARALDNTRYTEFAHRLLERGVRVLPRGTWFVSSAHTDDDIDTTLDAVTHALTRI